MGVSRRGRPDRRRLPGCRNMSGPGNRAAPQQREPCVSHRCLGTSQSRLPRKHRVALPSTGTSGADAASGRGGRRALEPAHRAATGTSRCRAAGFLSQHLRIGQSSRDRRTSLLCHVPRTFGIPVTGLRLSDAAPPGKSPGPGAAPRFAVIAGEEAVSRTTAARTRRAFGAGACRGNGPRPRRRSSSGHRPRRAGA